MKNPNSPSNKLKRKLIERWSGEEYPGASPRFNPMLFAKDILVFGLVPIMSVILFKACEGTTSRTSNKGNKKQVRRAHDGVISQSQIIRFDRVGGGTVKYPGILKRSPGTLIKLRLLNKVETYSNVPIHAQIVDASLGRSLMGGTLIGTANPDTTFERINITFQHVKHPKNRSMAVPVSARALSLDGTLGLIAKKKEGFFARSTLGGASLATEDMKGSGNSKDLKDVLFKALTAGLVQEFGSATNVEKNRAHVLTLRPGQEFFAELTDFFPGDAQ